MRVMTIVVVFLAIMFSTEALPSQASGLTVGTILKAHDWLNATPTPSLVRGKVVIVDFYTFGCINCQNVEPNLRALYRNTPRTDLVIIGVHSPETPYERDRANVVNSLKEQGIAWPVAIDNDFAIWNLCEITAWPTQLIFDRAGALQQRIVGDSQDDLVNATVNRLLKGK